MLPLDGRNSGLGAGPMTSMSMSSVEAQAARRRAVPAPGYFSSPSGSDGSSKGSYGIQGQFMSQYLRRIWFWDQMDFDSCFDQMVTLLNPGDMDKVYKLANYRKKTKNQWARDDPAFALVQVCA